MKKDEELSIEEQIVALNRILSKDLVAVTYQYEAEIGKGFFSFEVKMPGEAENEFFFMTVPIDLPTQGVVERYKYPFFREALPGTREYMLIMEDAEKLRDFLMGKGTKKALSHAQKVREIHPQVHCITNVITVNDCANALLAVGAVPIMSHHPLEVADVAKRSNALVLNMGAMES